MSSLSTPVSCSRVTLLTNLLAHCSLSWQVAWNFEVWLVGWQLSSTSPVKWGVTENLMYFLSEYSSTATNDDSKLLFLVGGGNQHLLTVFLVLVSSKTTCRLGRNVTDHLFPPLHSGRTKCWRYDIFSPHPLPFETCLLKSSLCSCVKDAIVLKGGVGDQMKLIRIWLFYGLWNFHWCLPPSCVNSTSSPVDRRHKPRYLVPRS